MPRRNAFEMRYSKWLLLRKGKQIVVPEPGQDDKKQDDGPLRRFNWRRVLWSAVENVRGRASHPVLIRARILSARYNLGQRERRRGVSRSHHQAFPFFLLLHLRFAGCFRPSVQAQTSDTCFILILNASSSSFNRSSKWGLRNTPSNKHVIKTALLILFEANNSFLKTRTFLKSVAPERCFLGDLRLTFGEM